MKKTLLAILAVLGILAIAVFAEAPPVLDLGFEGFYSTTERGHLKDDDTGNNVVKQWGTNLSVTDENVYDGEYALQINTTGNWGICAQVPNMSNQQLGGTYNLEFFIAGDPANVGQENLTVYIGRSGGNLTSNMTVKPAIDGSYTHFKQQVRLNSSSPVTGVEIYVMGNSSGKIYYVDNFKLEEIYENCNFNFEDSVIPPNDGISASAISDKAATGEKALELSYTAGQQGCVYYKAKSRDVSIFDGIENTTPFIYELSFKCASSDENTLPETLEWYFGWYGTTKIFDQITIEPDGEYKSYKLRFKLNVTNYIWGNPEAWCIIKPQENCKIYFDDVVIKKVYIADTESISIESEGIYKYTEGGKFVPFEEYEGGKTYAYNLVNIENNNPQAKSFSIVSALYDNGKLVSVNVTPVNASCEQVVHRAASRVTVPETPGNYTVKGFKLDLDTMKPLQ